MVSLLRRLLAVFLLMVSAFAFAADYQWEGYSGSLFADPVSACTDIATRAFSAGSYTYDHYVVYSTTSIRCYGKGTVASGGLVDPIGYTGRVGTGCTAPKVWNTTSLSCAVPPPVCPTSGTDGGWYTYNATASRDSFCIAGCSYHAGMSVGLGGEYATNAFSDGTTCSTNSTGLTPKNPNAQPCPSGTTQHGVDLSGTPICTGVDKPPVCWTGTVNVSTDPTMAICVDALPAAKDSETTAKAAATAATAALAAAKAATAAADAASQAVIAGANANAAAAASRNATAAAATAGTADQAAAQGSAANAAQSASAAAAAAAQARQVAEIKGAGSGSLPMPGTGAGGTGTGSGGGGDDVSAPGTIGDLYTKKDKTFAGELTIFKTAVMSSPVVSGATSFFTVSVGSASCPSWTFDVPFLHTSVNVGQFFCSSVVQSALTMIGIGILIGASIGAFKWAFL